MEIAGGPVLKLALARPVNALSPALCAPANVIVR